MNAAIIPEIPLGSNLAANSTVLLISSTYLVFTTLLFKALLDFFKSSSSLA